MRVRVGVNFLKILGSSKDVKLPCCRSRAGSGSPLTA